MTGNQTFLVLRLEGALQSWGESAKWDARDSADLPTKSGVVGLLGCALGLERGDPALAALSAAMRMAVRADRPGTRTVDFQTVTGDPLRNAEGKPKSTGNTIISRRAYLQDACFTVVLELEEPWRERVAAALRDPRWCICLGRKNCVPSRPALDCASFSADDLDAAIRAYPAAARPVFPMVYETEQESPALSGHTRPDRLLDGNRSFARRHVWRGIVKEEDHGSLQN